jgi:hypothetical protein
MLLFTACSAAASAADAPKYSNEFLSIGMGARALGMGGAAATTAADACAAYWNPALLTTLPQPRSAALMHAEYFAGVAKYDVGAFSYKPDTATALAFSVVRFGVDDIPNTTDLIDRDGNFSYDRLSYFSTADYAFTFSVGHAAHVAGQPVSLGASAKVVYRHVGSFAAAYGFGVDAGAHLRRKKWSFGLMLRDVTTTVNVWTFNASALEIPAYGLPSGDTVTNAVPASKVEVTLPKITLGASRHFRLSADVALLAELGLDFTTDGQRNVLLSSRALNVDPKLGVEGSYRGMVYLRLGLNNAQRITDFDNKQHVAVQPNLGVGLRYRGAALDYAITNIGAVGVSSYSNVFSLSYNF